MATNRLTILEIVNEVMRKLGLDTVSTVTETDLSTLCVDWVNDVVDDLCNYGDWQELYEEVLVTAQASVGTYDVGVSGGTVGRIMEIHWDDDVAPLEVRTISDIRRLGRLNSYGNPRQFCVVGVSGDNPIVRVHPVPVSATPVTWPGVFNIAVYRKPGQYTTSDGAITPPFPARVLVQGVYVLALTEEQGGEPTSETLKHDQLYLKQRNEAINRFNADTGTDVQFVPVEY